MCCVRKTLIIPLSLAPARLPMPISLGYYYKIDRSIDRTLAAKLHMLMMMMIIKRASDVRPDAMRCEKWV
jgi:hypothetical protein